MVAQGRRTRDLHSSGGPAASPPLAGVSRLLTRLLPGSSTNPELIPAPSTAARTRLAPCLSLVPPGLAAGPCDLPQGHSIAYARMWPRHPREGNHTGPPFSAVL